MSIRKVTKRKKKTDQYGLTRKEARGTRKIALKRARKEKGTLEGKRTKPEMKKLKKSLKFKAKRKKAK